MTTLPNNYGHVLDSIETQLERAHSTWMFSALNLQGQFLAKYDRAAWALRWGHAYSQGVMLADPEVLRSHLK